MVSTIMFTLTGLFIGAAFGFVMQRGRFCMNSAYREVLFQDYTMLRAYVLAIVVTMIGANLIEDMGWLQHADETGAMVVGTLYRQGFAPWANIIGGYIFGLGIVLAGGCGSGILYKVGEGNLAYIFAVFGFFFGIVITKFGFLKPVYDALISKIVTVGDGDTPTLANIIGVNKWIVIAVVTAAISALYTQGRTAQKSEEGLLLVGCGTSCRGCGRSGLVGIGVLRRQGPRTFIHRSVARVFPRPQLRELCERPREYRCRGIQIASGDHVFVELALRAGGSLRRVSQRQALERGQVEGPAR